MTRQIKGKSNKYEQYKVSKRYCRLQNKESKAVEVEEAGQRS